MVVAASITQQNNNVTESADVAVDPSITTTGNVQTDSRNVLLSTQVVLEFTTFYYYISSVTDKMTPNLFLPND
jgi:hypothetical protein